MATADEIFAAYGFHKDLHGYAFIVSVLIVRTRTIPTIVLVHREFDQICLESEDNSVFVNQHQVSGQVSRGLGWTVTSTNRYVVGLRPMSIHYLLDGNLAYLPGGTS